MYLKLHNFAILGSREFNFNYGLNTVLGPNGSGKSTLVNALYFAITGTSLDKVPSLQDLVTWGMPNASVTMDTDDFTVTRTIDSRGGLKHKLIIKSTGEIITRKAEVNTWLAEFYSLESLDALDIVYYSKQLNADALIQATTSGRLDILMHIFGMSKLDKARDILYGAAQSIVVEVENKDLHDSLENAVSQRTIVLQSMQENYDAKKKIYDEITGDLSELQYKAEKAPLDSDIQQLTLDSQLALDEAQRVSKALQELPQPYELNNEQFIAHATYVNAAKQLSDVESARAALTQTLPQDYVYQDSSEQLRDVADTIKTQQATEQAELKTLQYKLNNLRSGKCPVCGSTVESLHIDLDQLSADCTAKQDAINNMTSDLFIITNQISIYGNYDRQLSNLENATSTIKASMEANAYAKDFDSEDYDRKKAFNDKLLADRASLEQNVKSYERAAADLQQKLTQLVSIGKPVTNEERVDAISKLGAINLQKNAFFEAEKNLRDATVSLHQAEDSLFKYEESLKQNELKRAFLQDLKDSRSILHRDNLPRLMLQGSIAQTNKVLFELLQEIEFKYQVYLTTEGDVQYNTTLAEKRDASRLSGGQRYMLSNILRVAFASVIESTYPLMILDEPSTGLDENARQALATMLVKLGTLLEKKKMILIIPTFDDILVSASSRVVTIN